MTNKLDEVQRLLEERAARVLIENTDEDAILAAAAKIKERRDEKAAIIRATEKERKALEEAAARDIAERKRLDDAQTLFEGRYEDLILENEMFTETFYTHPTKYLNRYVEECEGDVYVALERTHDKSNVYMTSVMDWIAEKVWQTPGLMLKVTVEILEQTPRELREQIVASPYWYAER